MLCGRYTLTVDGKTLKDFFQIDLEGFDFKPRYNIAPGQSVPVVCGNPDNKKIFLMRWGLIPEWSKKLSIGYKMINARAETIDKKPAFRNSFYNRRCLIPADGFYEWKKENSKKLPVRIILPDKKIFAFAGIWDCWASTDGSKIFSFSIITTSANDYIKDIHERMPVILAEIDQQNKWLGLNETDKLKNLLKPYDGDIFAYKVSTLVNFPKNDNPHCIKKLKD
ncbi:MAG: hypothetical protein PWQ82_959 [Thermosediminibacterales bacterium]|nr:hypothetical protein [Thermosediminibacterales bacterium]